MEIEREREPRLIRPENWTAIRVFQGCRWTLLLGMQGVLHQGIAAQEVESVCRLLRVPRDERHSVLAAVRVMENAALPILNEKK